MFVERTLELQLTELVEPEVGEMCVIETPTASIKATWLGTVSNGKELAEAMCLMIAMEQEREREAVC